MAVASSLLAPPPIGTPFQDAGGRITSPWVSWLLSVASAVASVSGSMAGALLAANNLADLLNPATARANLGLGSAATKDAGYFDVAGAAAAVEALAVLLANNLSDLPDKVAARANLGLGSAATHPATDFDAAGAAAAAQAASDPLGAAAAVGAASGSLAGNNTWAGTQTWNNNSVIYGQLTLGYAMNWANALIFGTAQFSNDMLFPYSNGFWYASPNATGWYEFRNITSQGAGLANDYLGWQYNSRATAGAPDAWHDSFQLAALTGLLTFFSAVAFQLAPTFADQAGTRTNLGLGSAATQASSAFDASGAAAAVLASSLQKSANLSDLANAATARTNLGLVASAITDTTNAANISSGTLAIGRLPTVPLANGGTGQTTAPAALTALVPAWATWVPTITASGSMTATGATITDAQYIQMGPMVFFKLLFTVTLGGTASNTVFATMPVTGVGAQSNISCGYVVGSNLQVGFGNKNTATQFAISTLGASVPYTLGSVQFWAEGFYRVT